MPKHILRIAAATWGMGDALNTRAFLLEYCRQKLIKRSHLFVFCRPRYEWMFANTGFWILKTGANRSRLVPYPNFGAFNLPKTSSNPHQDLCLAESAGISFSYSTVAPLPVFPFPEGIRLPDKYITINTGAGPFSWSPDPDRVCIKAWPRDRWERFVSVIGVPCVQIGGGPSCFPVDGAVLDLRDRLTITESAEVMRRGLFHVDIEGGLPILNQHLGKKSVVLFGPTHPDQQGRSFNLNIRDTGCEACYEWGSRKYKVLSVRKSQLPCGAHCMADIDPVRVAERICDAGWLSGDPQVIPGY